MKSQEDRLVIKAYLDEVVVFLPGTSERDVGMRRLQRNHLLLVLAFFPDVNIQRWKQQILGVDFIVDGEDIGY